MEHVGRHLEKDRKSRVDMLDPATWNSDEMLERYLVNESIVIEDGSGWKIGDGKPRRGAALNSDSESEEN
jgi:hypothetical protein